MRLKALGQKFAGEKAAREEQTAKIDAIFAFVQQSAGAQPAASMASTRSGEPAHKKRKPSRRDSGVSEWTTVGPESKEKPAPMGQKRKRAGKRSAMAKQFDKRVLRSSGL